MKKSTNIIIYQTKSGKMELRGDFGNETIWATMDQIAAVFGRDKSVISRHLKSIYGEKELDENSTVAKNATVQIEGKRRVKRVIEYYNLDAIISVGYRVNSKTATDFRKWATSVLRQYVISGYVVNKKLIAQNYEKFMATIEDVRSLLPPDKNIDNKSILELVKTFADTWLSLDAYDKDALEMKKVTKRKVRLTAAELMDAIAELKTELIRKKEASDLFARERKAGTLAGIVGNVMQGFGGKDVYPGLEEKAANLLYFVIKDHPFADGNKRSGAYAFVWFLQRVRLLDRRQISPAALTAITLLIAESPAKEKEKMCALVVRILSGR